MQISVSTGSSSLCRIFVTVTLWRFCILVDFVEGLWLELFKDRFTAPVDCLTSATLTGS